MDVVAIARWQFGITTVYHFLLVPLTIGMGPALVFMQWRWLRTGDDRWYRMTRFWGKVYLINFIMGVATGIVQEFQFGLAWSEYSRFVGDVFGAPLAMEALLAFFVESTFLGLWIFGWQRLPRRLHLLALTLAAGASVLSAYFIIVANSWMQHPVGVALVHGHPVMTDVWAVLTNNTALVAFSHTIAGSAGVAGGFLLGIGWYQLWRRRQEGIDTVGADGRVVPGEDPAQPGRDRLDHRVWINTLRVGAVVAVLGFGAVAITGDAQGKLLFQQQPLKMASAEAACETGTSFSVLAVGDVSSASCANVTNLIEIPAVLSFLANGDFTTPVRGVNELIPQYQREYGRTLPTGSIYGSRSGQAIDYQPDMTVTYWGFRIMIGFGAIAAFAALVALWLTRKGTVPASKPLMRLALFGILAPFGANAAGWIFTEMGRQPFVVAPNPTGVDGLHLFTAAAVSPGVTAGELITSLVSFAALYGALLVVEVFLIARTVRGGVAAVVPELEPPAPADREDDVLAFAY
ncbi:cytochrome ubiquinol oxidase subunit I [Amnibacterium sp.]|uniref:cytochrome ubiquinol oxidase subunit I n=1 Tax=Amnibacterium sp. TaxID=1872496 RepID=UPI003F7C041D